MRWPRRGRPALWASGPYLASAQRQCRWAGKGKEPLPTHLKANQMLMLVLAFLSIALPLFALFCRFAGVILGAMLVVVLSPIVFVVALVRYRRKDKSYRK